MVAKKQWYTENNFYKIYSLKFCNIWQNLYFYRILNNENFQMEVEQMNFVTHLTINPFAPGDFAEKRVLKLVEWFSGHCHAIKS